MGITFNMISFDALTFNMGQEKRPTILSSYRISAEPISADLYNKVMKTSFTDEDFTPSWNDAITFCNELNKLAGLKSAYNENSCDFTATGYRLPTEAEWEAASFSSSFTALQGTKEWCYDTFANTTGSLQINPSGIAGGNQKVVKAKGAPTERQALQPEASESKCLFRICQSGSAWGQDTQEQENAYMQKLYEEARQKFAPLTNMVKVQGGTFSMGTAEGSSAPIHTVTVSSFEIGSKEVSVKLYKEVMGRSLNEFSSGEDCPVDGISWYQAVVFCNKLSSMLGLTPCYKLSGSSNTDEWGALPYATIEETSYGDTEAASYMNVIGDTKKWDTITCDFTASGYRLPTEAEWEFAARGGINDDKTKYSGSDKLEEAVICDATWFHKFTPVSGQKKPNSLGIYDMSGSAWEWCWDWFANYTNQSQENPTGPQTGNSRVRRGGSVFDQVDSTDYDVFSRNSYEPVYSSNSTWPFSKAGIFGFRIARSIDR